MSEFEPGRGGRSGDKDKKDTRGAHVFRRRRMCKFCVEKIDYTATGREALAPFIPERGKIQPRRISAVCATHQRALQTAIKRARQIALVPYHRLAAGAHTMSVEVILKEHVENLGQRGEIVKVASGYARNYPFLAAALAVTSENKKQVERERVKAEAGSRGAKARALQPRSKGSTSRSRAAWARTTAADRSRRATSPTRSRHAT